MQLVVLGMHRSGTSGVTRLLNMAGAYFGPEGISTEPNEENPKGFWERRDVRDVCDALLQGGDFDWWRVAGFTPDAIPDAVREEGVAAFRRILTGLDAHRPWVVKEPRLCLVLPVLRPLLEVPVCIHVVREPLEVAASVHARNGFPLQVAIALWETYTIRSLQASEGLPRVLVRYEELIADPVPAVGRLIEQLEQLDVQGLHLPTEREITAFVSADLHRQHAAPEARPGRLNEQQARLAAAIDQGAFFDLGADLELSPGAAETLEVFEHARDRFARAEELETESTRLGDDLAASTSLVADLERQAGELEQQLTATSAAAEADREQAAAAVEQAEVAQARADELEEQAAESDVRAAAAAQRADAADRRAAVADEHARVAVDRAGAAETRAAELERRLAQGTAAEAERARAVTRALASIEEHVRVLAKSQYWRLAWKGMSLRQRLTPRMAVQERSPLDRVLGDVRAARQELEGPVVPPDDVPPRAEETRSSPSAPVVVTGNGSWSRPRRDRPKVAVVAWDVGHNPLGRAYILADLLRRRFDVEIWGAQFARYGSRVWAPLRSADIPIRSFEGHPFPAHLGVMEDVARQIDADAIWVSKPRLPSLALGVLAKEVGNRPLVLDVDDHELAFFDEEHGLRLADVERRRDELDLSLPFERVWTRACDSVITAADQVTVSNWALQQRYGGLIVPHARDEQVFDPARYDRAETRRRLGVPESTRLLMFGGTPRVHKGIVEILRALEQLGDDRYRVALFGTSELEGLRDEIGDLDRWALPLPYQPFDQLAPLVGAADLACVLQDPGHPVSRYQLPAKVSDALAMGVPCLVRPVAPLHPLVAEGVLNTFDDDRPLHERIVEVFDHYDEALDRARRGRETFLREYSYEAVAERIAPVFDRLMDAPPPLTPRLRELVEVPRRLFPATGGGAPALPPRRIPGSRRRPIVPGDQYDLVVFWKQNDTSIYGRRQDMFVKYLERSGRFHTIVHFDNPITPEALVQAYRSGGGSADQSRLVARQTVSRLLGHRDSGRVRYHTYLYAGAKSRRLGLPGRADYREYVRTVLERHGLGGRPTVFWVYPTNEDFPALADALDPDLVVADVVDDNRTWYTEGSAHYDRIDRNYEEVLGRADLVLANCEPVAESMMRFAPEVHVVPNGCELPNGAGAPPRPKELRRIQGPVIGYVGNLSARIDIDLLEAVALARPDWNLVFVGSAHLDQSILRIDALPNVHFVGVKPYEETQRFVRHFDVALIPHVDNEMTRSMNPLKAFVYGAAGIPIVSTPIANIGELAGLITVAEGPEQFVAAIEAALRSGRGAPDLEVLGPHAWERRVEQVLALLDGVAGVPAAVV